MLGAVDSLSEELLYKRFENKLRDSPRHACPHLRREDVWLHRLNRHGQSKISHGSRLAGITVPSKQKWQEVEKEMLAYVHSLTEEQLQKTFTFLNVKGEPVANVLWQALQHLVTTHISSRTNHLDDSTARRNAGEY